MKYFKNTLIIFILAGLSLGLHGQTMPSQDQIHALLVKNWEQIEDYEVDIKLALNIPGFRMPSRKIHYLYKAPDKSKVEVKGFAIVPKQGIQPFFTFLKDSINLTVASDTTINGKPVFELVLNDTFMNEEGQISLYVDQENGNIYEAWVIHNDMKFFELTSKYVSVDGISLPSSTDILMKFPPDFKNIQRLGQKWNDMQEFEANMTDEWLEGSIGIKFTNYKVNQGIPDYRFEDDAEEHIQD